MRLGYDLTIEQTQKLTMTPELIQAIQILQYNSQELEEFVSKELLENPVLDMDSFDVRGTNQTDHNNEPEVSQTEKLLKQEAKEAEQADFDLREKVVEAEYDDISYRQWEHRVSNDEVVSFDQYTSKDETLTDYLLEQLTQ